MNRRRLTVDDVLFAIFASLTSASSNKPVTRNDLWDFVKEFIPRRTFMKNLNKLLYKPKYFKISFLKMNIPFYPVIARRDSRRELLLMTPLTFTSKDYIAFVNVYGIMPIILLFYISNPIFLLAWSILLLFISCMIGLNHCLNSKYYYKVNEDIDVRVFYRDSDGKKHMFTGKFKPTNRIRDIKNESIEHFLKHNIGVPEPDYNRYILLIITKDGKRIISYFGREYNQNCYESQLLYMLRPWYEENRNNITFELVSRERLSRELREVFKERLERSFNELDLTKLSKEIKIPFQLIYQAARDYVERNSEYIIERRGYGKDTKIILRSKTQSQQESSINNNIVN